MAKRPTPLFRDAEALLRQGIQALDYERLEEAAALLIQATQLAPESADAFLALGITLTRLLRIPEAAEALERAIVLAPENFYPHFRLAQVYLRVGVPTRAREELDKAMQLSETPEQRKWVRELLAADATRGARRAWRPDFTRLGRLWKGDK